MGDAGWARPTARVYLVRWAGRSPRARAVRPGARRAHALTRSHAQRDRDRVLHAWLVLLVACGRQRLLGFVAPDLSERPCSGLAGRHRAFGLQRGAERT